MSAEWTVYELGVIPEFMKRRYVCHHLVVVERLRLRRETAIAGVLQRSLGSIATLIIWRLVLLLVLV